MSYVLDLFESATDIRERESAQKKAYFREFWRSQPTSPGHIKTYFRRWSEFDHTARRAGHTEAMRMVTVWRGQDGCGREEP